jgi:hypothetical protein
MSADRPRDCVITAAYGVGPDYVRTFLRTFRAVNQHARVVLLVSNRAPLETVAHEFDVDLQQNTWLASVVPTIELKRKRQRVRVTEILSRTNRFFPRLSVLLPDRLLEVFVPLPVARLGHTRRVLAAEPMRSVLVTDCRDVMFQTDPFADPVDLVFAQEPNVYGCCAFNDKWIRFGFGEEILNRFRGRPIFCSGTILGRYERVREHMDRMWHMVRLLKSWRCFGQDQGIHNYLIHTQLEEGTYQVSTNQTGQIATLGLEKTIRLRDGHIVDATGRVFAVVHQYDRMPAESLRQLAALSCSSRGKYAVGY